MPTVRQDKHHIHLLNTLNHMIRINTQVQTLPTAAPQAPQATNDRPTVSEYIRDTIASLMRSGGKDGEDQERLAVMTLAELCRLTPSQAWREWIQYATQVNPS